MPLSSTESLHGEEFEGVPMEENAGYIKLWCNNPVLRMLPNELLGELVKALLVHHETGETVEVSPSLQFVYPSFEAEDDRDKERFLAMRKRQSDNVKKRWEKEKANNTTVYHGIPSNTTEYQSIPKIPENRIENRENRTENKEQRIENIELDNNNNNYEGSGSGSCCDRKVSDYDTFGVSSQELQAERDMHNKVLDLAEEYGITALPQQQKIIAMVADYGGEMVLQALDAMSMASKESWNVGYLQGILRNLKAGGGKPKKPQGSSKSVNAQEYEQRDTDLSKFDEFTPEELEFIKQFADKGG